MCGRFHSFQHTCLSSAQGTVRLPSEPVARELGGVVCGLGDRRCPTRPYLDTSRRPMRSRCPRGRGGGRHFKTLVEDYLAISTSVDIVQP